MSPNDEDDKPTVVLDLNALKKQKLKQEEELANIASELEFNVGGDEAVMPEKERSITPPPSAVPLTVIFFDFQSDFFKKSLVEMPKGFNYHVAKTLPELNQHLKSKNFQIVVFNYDVNPKAVNQLCAQMNQKNTSSKTLIMAKAISPEKAKIHATTASGANGYYQLPIEAAKLEKEFLKIRAKVKNAS